MSNRYPLIHWIRFSGALGILFVLIFAVPSHSAIFKWKDENGKTHFTDDISKIPAKYRKKDDLETLKGAPADPSDPVKLLFPKYEATSNALVARPYGDGHFIVEVSINGNVKANLMVDTGATMIVLSDRIGKALGVTDNKDLPVIKNNTAGGVVESPLFILESFKVGSLEGFNMEATTNPNFKKKGMDGLLGMSFLGEFKMEIDRQNNKIFLKPLVGNGETLWDGHNEKWWKNKYAAYVSRMRELRNYVNKYMMKAEEYHNSRKLIAHYSKLHEGLEKRANQFNLPKEFRLYP